MKTYIACNGRRINIKVLEYDNFGIKALIYGTGHGSKDAFLAAVNKGVQKLAKVVVENVVELTKEDYESEIPTNSISYTYSLSDDKDQSTILDVRYSDKYSRIISGYFKGRKNKADRHHDYITDDLESTVESTIKELQDKANRYNSLGIYKETPEILGHNIYELSEEILKDGTVREVSDRLASFEAEQLRSIGIFEDGMAYFYGRKVNIVRDGRIEHKGLYDFIHGLGYKLLARYVIQGKYTIEEIKSDKYELLSRKPTYMLAYSTIDNETGDMVEKTESLTSGVVFYNGQVYTPNFMIGTYITSKLRIGTQEEAFLSLVSEYTNIIRKKTESKEQSQVDNQSKEDILKLIHRVFKVKRLDEDMTEFRDMILDKPRIRCKEQLSEGHPISIQIYFPIRRYWYTDDEVMEHIRKHKDKFDKCVAFAILTQPMCKQVGGIESFDITTKLVEGSKLIYELHRK